jgi:signal transduction histidine kinase
VRKVVGWPIFQGEVNSKLVFRVVSNLIGNALDALPENGVLRLRLKTTGSG